jgi:hypothetical protein
MTEAKFTKYLQALARNKERVAKSAAAEIERKESELKPCCQGNVHIAYRGVSDDRLYMSRDRGFGEIKYFRPNGLRIFCADCRRRLV